MGRIEKKLLQYNEILKQHEKLFTAFSSELKSQIQNTTALENDTNKIKIRQISNVDENVARPRTKRNLKTFEG